MAWRIEHAVTHGEIDNTVEGQTTGKIWLAGRDEPLILSLVGDCWRDLAGARLQFENPTPKPESDANALDTDQKGIVGDMTASRKIKAPTVSDERAHELYQNQLEVPCEWRNTLYLEWFSEINGRVVIETAGFRLSITSYEWQMDADAENAQKLANLNSMRDFMAQIIRRRDPEEVEQDPSGELDEFAWEERLKESDRLTDAYQEVLEKYMEDADSDQKEAFVMGWDGLLDALAERDEAAAAGGDPHEEWEFDAKDYQSHPFDYDEECDEENDLLPDCDVDDNHPLQARAQALALRAMDVIGRDDGPGSLSYQLINNLLQVSGKLAGVLHGSGNGRGYEPEIGFVMAMLKRCLNWLNEAVGACHQLLAMETDPERRDALQQILSTAFGIREGIVELRRELR
jgi:hypothetical protein